MLRDALCVAYLRRVSKLSRTRVLQNVDIALSCVVFRAVPREHFLMFEDSVTELLNISCCCIRSFHYRPTYLNFCRPNPVSPLFLSTLLYAQLFTTFSEQVFTLLRMPILLTIDRWLVFSGQRFTDFTNFYFFCFLFLPHLISLIVGYIRFPRSQM